MGLVNQDEDVIALAEDRIFLSLVVAEFMNHREDELLVALKVFTKLLRIFRLAFFIPNYFSALKVFINLLVKIRAVGHDEEGKIACELAATFPRKENHGIRFARTLRVPEHTKLSFQFLSALNITHKVVDPKELVVFCDDFDLLILKQNKVFYVINQVFLFTQTAGKILN